MTEALTVLFPDAVDLAISALTDGFAAAPVAMTAHGKVPKERPARFTLVRRDGGTPETLVTDGARLTVESWAETDQQAMSDAQLCQAILRAARGTDIDGVTIAAVRIEGGPSNFPDPLSNTPRVTQIIRLAGRGSTFP